jgi:hypothetical protein
MALRNKPPVPVAREYRAELAKLSKAALMDMVWDYVAHLGLRNRADARGNLGRVPGQVGDCF